jgi:hypothetical protein
MSVSHSHLTKTAELDYERKNHLDYVSETTSFRFTESTRDGCIAMNPGAEAL